MKKCTCSKRPRIENVGTAVLPLRAQKLHIDETTGEKHYIDARCKIHG